MIKRSRIGARELFPANVTFLLPRQQRLQIVIRKITAPDKLPGASILLIEATQLAAVLGLRILASFGQSRKPPRLGGGVSGILALIVAAPWALARYAPRYRLLRWRASSFAGSLAMYCCPRSDRLRSVTAKLAHQRHIALLIRRISRWPRLHGLPVKYHFSPAAFASARVIGWTS